MANLLNQDWLCAGLLRRAGHVLAAAVAVAGAADAAGGAGRARVHVQDAAADHAGEHLQELQRLHRRPGKRI